MEVEVFGDLLFLVNFSMDYLTLYLCAHLCSRPLPTGRALLASGLGALYAVAVLFLPAAVPVPLALLTDALVCLGLCTVGLYRRGESVAVILRLGGVYLLISALLGGVMTALCALLNRVVSGQELRDATGEENLTFLTFSLLLPILGAVCVRLCRLYRRAAARRTARLIVCEGGRSAELHALCDSGNLVRDPLSGLCLILVDSAAVGQILPLELLQHADELSPTQRIAALPPHVGRRCRLIPAKGALGSGLLLAFRPDHLYLDTGSGKREVTAYVSPVPLCASGRGEHTAVLPSELLLK